MSFKTAKGTTFHYNLEGWNKTSEEVTIKIEDVLSFSGLEISREAMKEDDLETQTEVSAPGKTTCSDFELSVRVREDSKVFETFHEAMISGSELTGKIHLPVGAGLDFLTNCTVTKVGVPTESNGFLHINMTFSPCGVPTLVK